MVGRGLVAPLIVNSYERIYMMIIKKKEIKRILAKINRVEDFRKLTDDGVMQFIEDIIYGGADLYHAMLVSICLHYNIQYVSMVDALQDKPLNSDQLEKLCDYYKVNTVKSWSEFVNEDLNFVYSMDYEEYLAFWNEREKEVNKAWKIIKKWVIEKYIEWEREIFSNK